MIALESLAELRQRSPEARDLVGSFLAQTQASGLPESEIDSIVGSLRWLRSESIGQAGRRLARSLEPRRYMDLSSVQFFTRCYDLRSRLMHGVHPMPTREEIDAHAANRGEALNDLRRFIFFAHPRRSPLPAPRRPDHPSPLPHAGRQCLHLLHDVLPPRRHQRPQGRGPPPERRGHRPLKPRPFRGDQPLRHAQLRRRQRPQTASPAAPQRLTRISGRLRRRFGAVTQ